MNGLRDRMKVVGEMDTYLEVLAHELSGDDDTFMLKLRCDLVWDRDAFSRLTEAMLGCCRAYDLDDTQPVLMEPAYDKERLPRWIAEGFWYLADLVPAHCSHPEFPRPFPPEYYEAAFRRLRDLAEWFFSGKRPYLPGHGFEPL